MIIEIFPSGPLETNAMLIGCPVTRKAAIIDPAYGSKTLLLEKASDLNLDIEKIYLTHSHWDHTADLAEVKKATDAMVYVHLLDRENVIQPGSDGLPLLFHIEPVQPEKTLEDLEKHTIGKLSFEVLHTPGHSPGSVCFYFEKEKVLLSGDTLFKGSYGNLSFPGCSEKDMVLSLQRLAKLPKDVQFFPGHGPSSFLKDETWISSATQLLEC